MKILSIILLIFAVFGLSELHSFGLDLYSSPVVISLGEIYLLSNAPETSFYQPAKSVEGISLTHSNPHGFRELNVFQLSSQIKAVGELFYTGVFVLDNDYISDKIFYLGYTKSINQLSLGANVRYYHQSIENYHSLDAFTVNLGIIWQNRNITHGLTYSNLSHTSKNGIYLPTLYKYEFMISPIEKTNFALSLEKEKDFDLRYAFAVSREIASIFSINTGFITNPNQFSVGVMVKMNDFDVSIGVRTHSQLGYTQAIGVVYRI